MPLKPGTYLGPYEILGALGAGGMGEVHRARDPMLGREVQSVRNRSPLYSDPQAGELLRRWHVVPR